MSTKQIICPKCTQLTAERIKTAIKIEENSGSMRIRQECENCGHQW